MPKLIIDGRETTVPDGTTVMRAAEELGIFIPRYCYHPALSVVGNCRICLVEAERFPKLQVSCNMPVMEGMVVHTQSEKAQAGRRAALEFLLANHPLDCPVCDQAGECDLQNFYMEFGLHDPRFAEQKVKKHKAVKLGPHVMLDAERCILCSRCVRFTDEITGTGEFGIFNRGDRSEVGIFPGEELDNPYSANVVDLCPVGALTEVDSRFKARVWFLSSAPTVCNGCSMGCNLDLHYVLDRPHLNDGARIVRVKPRTNPDVNQWWLCDQGRFGFGWVDEGRLLALDGPSAAVPPSWEHALTQLAQLLGAMPAARIGVIASAQLSNEELFLVREVFQRGLEARVTAALPQQPGQDDNLLIKADKNPNTAGATLLGLAGPDALEAEALVEAAVAGELDALWVFGPDLVELCGQEQVSALAEGLELFVFCGTNENATAKLAHWVLPSAAYVEKDGTFVNCHGRVQRIRACLPPLGDSRPDLRILLELAHHLGQGLSWRDAEQVFRALADAEPAFAGLDYQSIGDMGAQVATGPGAEVPAS